MALKKETFENIVRKGENAGNQHFLLVQQCFLPNYRQNSIILAKGFLHLRVLSIHLGLNFCCWPGKKFANNKISDYTGLKAFVDLKSTVPHLREIVIEKKKWCSVFQKWSSGSLIHHYTILTFMKPKEEVF